MNITQSGNTTSRTPLRLWPAVVAALLLLLVRFVLPVVAPQAEFFGMDAQLVAILGGLVGAIAILVWWLFFSRARWSERLIAIGLMIVAIVVTRPFTHISIQNGLMGRCSRSTPSLPPWASRLSAGQLPAVASLRVFGARRWSSPF